MLRHYRTSSCCLHQRRLLCSQLECCCSSHPGTACDLLCVGAPADMPIVGMPRLFWPIGPALVDVLPPSTDMSFETRLNQLRVLLAYLIASHERAGVDVPPLSRANCYQFAQPQYNFPAPALLSLREVLPSTTLVLRHVTLLPSFDACSMRLCAVAVATLQDYLQAGGV